MKTLPSVHVRVRRKLCDTCPTPCEAFTHGELVLEDAVLACPLPRPRWRATPVAARPFGLGDVVALVAKPIAKAVDAVAGTDLKDCGGCGRRQERLNKAVPDVLGPFLGK